MPKVLLKLVNADVDRFELVGYFVVVCFVRFEINADVIHGKVTNVRFDWPMLIIHLESTA